MVDSPESEFSLFDRRGQWTAAVLGPRKNSGALLHLPPARPSDVLDKFKPLRVGLSMIQNLVGRLRMPSAGFPDRTGKN